MQSGLIGSDDSSVTSTLLHEHEHCWYKDQFFKAFTEANGLDPSCYRLLEKLYNYKTVIILDDSSSMNELVNPETSMTLTKWHECKHILKIILDAHEVMNISCDFYTLNRGFKRNVACWQQVKPFLSAYPEGDTNLIRTLNYIHDYEMSLGGGDKPLLMYILTDGFPTNEAKLPDVAEFRDFLVLKNHWKQPTHYSLFFANDAEELEWYYWRLKEKHEEIDFTKTFLGELNLVQRSYNSTQPPFTFADYVLKILLGPIDAHYHQLDARRSFSRCLCCSIC